MEVIKHNKNMEKPLNFAERFEKEKHTSVTNRTFLNKLWDNFWRVVLTFGILNNK